MRGRQPPGVCDVARVRRFRKPRLIARARRHSSPARACCPPEGRAARVFAARAPACGVGGSTRAVHTAAGLIIANMGAAASALHGGAKKSPAAESPRSDDAKRLNSYVGARARSTVTAAARAPHSLARGSASAGFCPRATPRATPLRLFRLATDSAPLRLGRRTLRTARPRLPAAHAASKQAHTTMRRAATRTRTARGFGRCRAPPVPWRRDKRRDAPGRAPDGAGGHYADVPPCRPARRGAG